MDVFAIQAKVRCGPFADPRMYLPNLPSLTPQTTTPFSIRRLILGNKRSYFNRRERNSSSEADLAGVCALAESLSPLTGPLIGRKRTTTFETVRLA